VGSRSEAQLSASLTPIFHIVLVEPEIPHNTGAAGRLALATGATLHLVEPLGFLQEDKYLRRMGLDFWKDVDVHTWLSFDALRAAAGADARFWYLTTKGETSPWDGAFAAGDCLVFGCETRGLSDAVLNPHLVHRADFVDEQSQELLLHWHETN